MAKSNSQILLSHSGLDILNRCPQCFWLRYNKGIYQPEGIVSRLPDRFDNIIKKYFDLYRPIGELPPMIAGQIEGKLENPFQEKYYYDIDDKYLLYGKLDDCLVTNEGLYTPIDHKTTSANPRERDVIYPSHQTQLDIYALLLEKNNKKTTGIGHLIFYYPNHSDNLHQGCKIDVVVKTLKTNPKKALEIIKKSIEVIEFKKPPPPALDCPFCNWYEKIKKVIK